MIYIHKGLSENQGRVASCEGQISNDIDEGIPQVTGFKWKPCVMPKQGPKVTFLYGRQLATRSKFSVAKNFRLKMHVLNLFYGYLKATTARSCVYGIIFRFPKRTFWRENVSDLECNKNPSAP